MLQHVLGRLIRFGPDAQVKVGVWPETGFCVEPGHGPAFGDQRIDTGRAKPAEDQFQPPLLDSGVESLIAVRLLELNAYLRPLELTSPDSPPAQAASSSRQQQRGHRAKLQAIQAERLGHRTPGPAVHPGYQRAPLPTWQDLADLIS